jgi:hypothetical protein
MGLTIVVYWYKYAFVILFVIVYSLGSYWLTNFIGELGNWVPPSIP